MLYQIDTKFGVIFGWFAKRKHQHNEGYFVFSDPSGKQNTMTVSRESFTRQSLSKDDVTKLEGICEINQSLRLRELESGDLSAKRAIRARLEADEKSASISDVASSNAIRPEIDMQRGSMKPLPSKEQGENKKRVRFSEDNTDTKKPKKA